MIDKMSSKCGFCPNRFFGNFLQLQNAIFFRKNFRWLFVSTFPIKKAALFLRNLFWFDFFWAKEITGK
jgi:hypothetical protein